jgi:large conductance mechanosensitive channel
MLKGFRKFIIRGNFVDMAVGVVVGGAFTTAVTALTKDLLTPLIAALVGKPDFSTIRFTVNGSVFAFGDFINAIVSLVLVALAVYFFVVVPINTMTEEGSNGIRKVFTDHAHGMEDALSRLNHTEKEALANLLRKLGYTTESLAPGNGSNDLSEDASDKQQHPLPPSLEK